MKMNYELITELAQRLKQGDMEALEQIYEATSEKVFFCAFKIFGDENDASDIVQEVFLKIFLNISSLEDPKAFPKWLYTGTMNECRRKIRKEKKLILTDEGDTYFEQFFNMDPELDVQVAQKDVKDYIFTVLDLLPKAQRRAVVMYYYEQLSISEIAEKEGVPKGTVKSRLYLARKKLQKAVEAEERRIAMKL